MSAGQLLKMAGTFRLNFEGWCAAILQIVEVNLQIDLQLKQTAYLGSRGNQFSDSYIVLASLL